MRRASVSIASNISEGASRKSNLEFNRFLQIALGSAYELETQLLIASQLNYFSTEEFKLLNDQLESIIRQMRTFQNQLPI